ncbi:MAG: glycosyltransferase 87 family protein [Gemmataceae bacterium]|nr:glycosyltransferase 87 family protein [Gemmataceae bacterium]MDW8265452.1 glycosyltransferase 87 family protein [Gemmataceae bacterium]
MRFFPRTTEGRLALVIALGLGGGIAAAVAGWTASRPPGGPLRLALPVPTGGPIAWIWLAVQTAALLWAADSGWQLYGGPRWCRGLAWLVALTFAPTVLALDRGQPAVWVLLAVTGFLWFRRTERDLAAGLCLGLGVGLPYLIGLLVGAAVLWAVRERRGRVMLGMGIGLVGAVAWRVWLSGLVPSWEMGPCTGGATPATVGFALRRLVGSGPWWLGQVPLLVGAVWLLRHWGLHRWEWDWQEQTPFLLLGSALTAPCAAWPFDLPVLLVPWLAALADMARGGRLPLVGAVTIHVLIQVGFLRQMSRGADWFDFVWMVPVLTVVYWSWHALRDLWAVDWLAPTDSAEAPPRGPA